MRSFKMIENKETLAEISDDVVIYTIAEPGAMGVPCLMEFVTKAGERFYLFFGEKLTWSDITSNFHALDGCFFNGPGDGEKEEEGELTFFVNEDEKNCRRTKVTNGWKHIYMGFGNHLIIKEHYFVIFKKYIEKYTSPAKIYRSWQDHLDDFIKEINK